MATTVNNTTANSRITIVFDSGINDKSENDGPRLGTGNTESDVYIDNKTYYNVRSHTEIDANVHALQWNATTNTGELEYIDNRENEALTSFPQWATNVVIRCEAQDIWKDTYDNTKASQLQAWQDAGNSLDTDVYPEDIDSINTAADTARNNYLLAHNITF